MPLNTYGDNPVTPGINQSTFVPDQLIAGDMKVVTDTVTFTGGAVITRGAALGQVALGAAAAAVAAGAGGGGSNTGNGTCTAQANGAKAKQGAYLIKFTSATAFTVVNPNGVELAPGVALGAYNDPEISFTLTAGGTPFAANDGFSINIPAGAGGYKLAAAAATDGSQTPVAIAADTVDASGGDVSGPIYVQGEFNTRAVTLGAGITSAAAKAALQPLKIYLKSSDSAADPS